MPLQPHNEPEPATREAAQMTNTTGTQPDGATSPRQPAERAIVCTHHKMTQHAAPKRKGQRGRLRTQLARGSSTHQRDRRRHPQQHSSACRHRLTTNPQPTLTRTRHTSNTQNMHLNTTRDTAQANTLAREEPSAV